MANQYCQHCANYPDQPPSKICKNPEFHATYTKRQKEYLETAFCDTGNVLLQQVLGGQFVVYDGNEFSMLTEYLHNGVKIRPIDGEEVKKGFVLLAEKAVDYKSVSALVEEIKLFSSKYCDVPEDFRTFAAYFVLNTWVYDKASTTPYLKFEGDTGCGKSRAADVFGSLCYNFISVSGAANSAPVFRVIAKWGGTLGFEESDFKKSDETNELVKIINCGFEKGKPVLRCDKNKPKVLNFFDAYGPKIFAMRKRFDDAATEGRCLTQIMQQTGRIDIPPILPSIFYQESLQIRNKLLCFRLRNFRKINADNILPLPENLEPRLKQLAAPFSMVFSSSLEDWKSFINFMQDYQKQIKEARLNSETGIILQTLLDLASSSDRPIICKDISESLKIPLTKVSRELRALGFKTENKHVETEGKRKTVRAIIIEPSQWTSICGRYFQDTVPVPSVLCQVRQVRQIVPELNSFGTAGTNGTLNTDSIETATIICACGAKLSSFESVCLECRARGQPKAGVG